MPADAYRDDELLRRWISGALTAPEEAELERRAAADPTLREALDGLRSAPEADHAAHIAAMVGRARPAARVRRLPYQRYAAAATVLVLLAVLALLLPRYLADEATADEAIAMTQTAPPPAEPRAAPPASEVTAPVPAPAPAPRRPETEATPPTTATKRAPVVEDAEEAVTVEEALADHATPAPPATPPAPQTAPALPPPPADAAANRTLLRRARAPAYVQGFVTDPDGSPLPGAEVRRPGQALGVRTDSSGAFAVPYDMTLSQLEISHPDYGAETVEVIDTSAELQVSLTEDGRSRDVTRPQWKEDMDRARLGLPPAVRPQSAARPAEGYRTLRERIERDRPAGLPAGRVRVNFLVGADGSLTDFRFRGQPDTATMNYVGTTLVETSSWTVVQGEAPVRVYVTLRFE